MFGRFVTVAMMLAAGALGAEPLRVALYVDDGCRGSGVVRWAEILRDSPEAELKIVDGADIRAGALDDRELLVMPGGWGGPQYRAMGDAGADRLRAFVANGGAYFGTCCGIANALNEEPGFAKRLKMLPLKRKDGPVRGGFTATVNFSKRGAEWLGIREGDWSIRYHNGPVMQPSDPVPLCTELEVLATMNCELAQVGPVQGSMYGTPAAVRAKYGKGTMLAFNCHPEMFPSSREIVLAGVRALTGKTIRPAVQPLKPRGAERVGYYTTVAFDKDYLDGYFKLRADPAIDVVPVTQDELDEGMSARFDRIERPRERSGPVSVKSVSS